MKKNIYLENKIVIGQIMRANHPMDWSVGANVATQLAHEINLDKELSYSISGVDLNRLHRFAEQTMEHSDAELGTMMAEYNDQCHGWVLSEIEKEEGMRK